MRPVQIPALCPSCGALFASRMLAISGNVKNLKLSGNKETCPFCGEWAQVADGIFNVADNILSVIAAPKITNQMLAAFSTAIKTGYEQKKPPEELAREVEKIDPSFGEVIRKSGSNKQFYLVALLLILAAIKSCSFEVKLDANRLIDQIQGTPPSIVMSAKTSGE